MLTSGLMSESAFQDKVLTIAHSEGNLAQRFVDSIAIGIPDTFIGTLSYGAWLECKWAKFPKLRSTPLLTLSKKGLRGEQHEWLMRAWRRPNDSGVLVGTPDGWIAVPAPMMMKKLILGPAIELRSHVRVDKPSLLAIRQQMEMSRWQ